MGTDVTITQYITRWLCLECGVPDEDTELIISMSQSNVNLALVCWQDYADTFSKQVLDSIKFYVKDEALKYIGEKYPDQLNYFLHVFGWYDD